MDTHHTHTDAGTKASRVPTASRVAGDTLVELVYDAESQGTGLAVSRFGGLWNIEQEVRVGNELLVPYAPSNNLIANGCVLLPSKPVEFGFKNELLADIRDFLHRYVDLSPLFEDIAAHYVLLTWVHDRFGELPYLRLRGDFGTGKTRGLMAIGSLCYRGFFASGASTVSPIFHTLNAFGGTLILDEADLPFSDAKVDLVKILNNGTIQGVPVLRTIVNRHKEFNPQAFKVFGPKVIAMRGAFEDAALESRFITEETGQRPLRLDVPIQTPTSLRPEALQLRNRLLHYRLCHYFDVGPDLSVLMVGVEPRINQTALALLSLVDDPGLRERIQQEFRREDGDMRADRMETVEIRVLAATYLAFRGTKKDVSVREIAERFNAAHCAEYGAPLSNKAVGHVLRKKLRIGTRKSDGVYVVSIADRPKVDALASRVGLVS